MMRGISVYLAVVKLGTQADPELEKKDWGNGTRLSTVNADRHPFGVRLQLGVLAGVDTSLWGRVPGDALLHLAGRPLHSA